MHAITCILKGFGGELNSTRSLRCDWLTRKHTQTVGNTMRAATVQVSQNIFPRFKGIAHFEINCSYVLA